jgi:hypothetical protein
LANPNIQPDFYLRELWLDFEQNICKKIVDCCLNIPEIRPTLFFQCFKLDIFSISYQQAVVVEHRDFPNTEISSLKMSLLNPQGFKTQIMYHPKNECFGLEVPVRFFKSIPVS